MQSKQLGSVGWGITEPVVETPLAAPSEQYQAGLNVLVDLPILPLVGQQDEKYRPISEFLFRNFRRQGTDRQQHYRRTHLT